MITSLLRITIFLAIVAALAFGAVYLADNGGNLPVVVGTTEFNLGPLQLIIVIAIALGAIWLFFRLIGLLFATIRFLTGDETAISRYFNRNRERRGFEALSTSLIALAEGDAATAYRASAKAEKLLRRPDLTDLITAQAAERVGDHSRATAAYKRLLEDRNTRFAAVRGLLGQRLKSEEEGDQALRLAEKAVEMKPRNREVLDILLRLQAARREWAGARTTLRQLYSAGHLPKDLWKRRDGVLATGQAEVLLGSEYASEGGDLAIATNKQVPDLTEAALLAARVQNDRAKPKLAATILKKAWDATPHPALVAAYAALEPDETPEARLKRMVTLFGKGTSDEGRIALAELQMAAGDYPEARRTLLPLVDQPDAEARALTLMAAIERGTGATEAVVRGWLAKAISAPRGKQWVCETCETVGAEWEPACPHCHAIDSMSWTHARGAPMALPGADLTLPLLVGNDREEWH